MVEGADDKIQVNWDLAGDCDEAQASLCPTGALEMFGKRMTVDEVLDEVEKDASFYRSTGGGMTLSGGECLLQPDFSAALLAEAHARGFNTAIETACNVPWKFVEKVLPHVDTVLHDHKIVLNIQRYCSHDGPGIRTNVFLKGCSLRCKWCGNPESIAFKPELSYHPKKCTGKEACGACLKPPFPEGAFYVVEGGEDDKVRVNWDLAGSATRRWPRSARRARSRCSASG